MRGNRRAWVRSAGPSAACSYSDLLSCVGELDSVQVSGVGTVSHSDASVSFRNPEVAMDMEGSSGGGWEIALISVNEGRSGFLMRWRTRVGKMW